MCEAGQWVNFTAGEPKALVVSIHCLSSGGGEVLLQPLLIETAVVG